MISVIGFEARARGASPFEAGRQGRQESEFMWASHRIKGARPSRYARQ